VNGRRVLALPGLSSDRDADVDTQSIGLDTIVIVPISPVPPPPSSTVGPSDVSVAGGATDMKPGDFVKSRRKVEKQGLVHKVGDKVKGLYYYIHQVTGDIVSAKWFPAVVTAVNGDGTCTLKWDDRDTTQTLKKSTGEIRGPNAVFTITSTFDDTLYCAVVKAKLTDVFKEADADKDGKLTYDEWKTRMGKLVSADELKRLFEECDTDKNGSLDTKEFAMGMTGKYEIQWAQVCISSSLPSPAPPRVSSLFAPCRACGADLHAWSKQISLHAYQFQDPQEDKIRDAKDLILVPDSMTYYREHKEQEQEKAKREQAIAELQSLLLDQKHEESETKRVASEMCMIFTFVLVPEFFFLFFSLVVSEGRSAKARNYW